MFGQTGATQQPQSNNFTQSQALLIQRLLQQGAMVVGRMPCGGADDQQGGGVVGGGAGVYALPLQAGGGGGGVAAGGLQLVLGSGQQIKNESLQDQHQVVMISSSDGGSVGNFAASVKKEIKAEPNVSAQLRMMIHQQQPQQLSVAGIVGEKSLKQQQPKYDNGSMQRAILAGNHIKGQPLLTGPLRGQTITGLRGPPIMSVRGQQPITSIRAQPIGGGVQGQLVGVSQYTTTTSKDDPLRENGRSHGGSGFEQGLEEAGCDSSTNEAPPTATSMVRTSGELSFRCMGLDVWD